MTFSSSGRWLAVGNPGGLRYYIYDTDAAGGPVFTSDPSSGDTSMEWSIVSQTSWIFQHRHLPLDEKKSPLYDISAVAQHDLGSL